MDEGGRTRRPVRRRYCLVGAAAAVALVTAGAIVAVVASRGSEPKPSAAPPAAVSPNAIPFTGTYRVDYGPATDLDGKPAQGSPPPNTVTWGVRSVCRPSGCVAAASSLDGESPGSTRIFDEVDGRWVAVVLESNPCINPPAEYWSVFALQPRADGTLAGEWSLTSAGCAPSRRAMTVTRIGDVDVNRVADPAGQPPRVATPAQALRGNYHLAKTFGDGTRYEADMAVRTECLRTGDRCVSYFHNPDSFAALVFGGTTWTVNGEHYAPCPAGGTSHVKATAVYPLPAPPQDPITLLTGHGHEDVTGSACSSGNFVETIVRTGD